MVLDPQPLNKAIYLAILWESKMPGQAPVSPLRWREKAPIRRIKREVLLHRLRWNQAAAGICLPRLRFAGDRRIRRRLAAS